MSDKWLENQEDLLPQGLNTRDVSLERMLNIDLSKERNQEQINPYGRCDLFLITQIDGEAYVQFNNKNAPKIPVHRVPKIKRKFDNVYLTNEAQDASFSALLGGDLEGSKESLDAQSLSEVADQIEIIDTVGVKPVDLNDLFKTSDFTETRTIDQDNVGLMKTTDFEQAKNVQISLVNQDVNASTFTSSEKECSYQDEVYYAFTGDGSFDLTLEWTDGGGNVLKTHNASSSDGSELTNTLTQKGNHFILTIEDTSGASNEITGTFNIH